MTLPDATAPSRTHRRRSALLALMTAITLATSSLVTAAPATAALRTIVVVETPRIATNAAVGRSIAATPTTVEAVETEITRTHQWFIDDAAIAGATSSMYRPLAEHVGKKLKVRETLTADGYEPKETWSQETVVAKGVQTGRATVGLTSDTAQVGVALVMHFAGVSTRTAGMTITPEWTVGGTTVTGGFDFWGEMAIYTPRPADAGKKIKVVTTFEQDGYEDYVVTSPELTVQPGTLYQGAGIHGDRTVGSTVQAFLGDARPEGFTSSIRWLRNGTPIPGATGETYTLTKADLEQRLSLEATLSAPGYTTRTNTSDAFTVLRPVLKALTPVTIGGTGKVGAPLRAEGDTWNATPTTRVARWLRDGEPIAGGTATLYTPVAADVGHDISVELTASAADHHPGTTTSEAITITRGTLAPTAPPRITGSAAVGKTLTAHPGTWPAGTKTTVQWLRDGSPIKGATATTYRIAAADARRSIAVRVGANATGYAAATATSAAVRVSAGTLTPTTGPTVVGTAKVGGTLTAKPGTWPSAGATFTFQWLRSGKAITGSTRSTYTVTKADIGTKLSVRVTTTAAGTTGTATSPTTSAIAKVVPKVTTSAPKRVKAGARTRLTIKVDTAAVTKQPAGKVTITWGKGKKKSRTITLKAKHKGRITYRLPALPKGKHKVTVRFTPNAPQSKHLTPTSLTRTLNAR